MVNSHPMPSGPRVLRDRTSTTASPDTRARCSKRPWWQARAYRHACWSKQAHLSLSLCLSHACAHTQRLPGFRGIFEEFLMFLVAEMGMTNTSPMFSKKKNHFLPRRLSISLCLSFHLR